MEKEITREEKLKLLKSFLKEEVYFKALTDTFTDKELDKYMDDNIESLLNQTRGKNE